MEKENANNALVAKNNALSINMEDLVTKTDYIFFKEPILIPFIQKLKIIPMAIDIGYSAIKTFGMFGRHIIPAIPLKVKKDTVEFAQDNHIKFKDNEGNLWYIGDLVSTTTNYKQEDVNETRLYSIDRIKSKEYKILAELGIYFGMLENNYTVNTDGDLYIQTGLPSTQTEEAEVVSALRQAFIGKHQFSVKIGKNPWVDIDITVKEDNLKVMEQPFGTIWSLGATHEGKFLRKDLLESKNVLVFDAGFYSIDTYYARSGRKTDTYTWQDHAMKEVLLRTSTDIELKTSTKKPKISEYTKYFTDPVNPGMIIYNKGQNKHNIMESLMPNLVAIANEILVEMEERYEYFEEVHTLIMTGGTGKAYYEYFKNNIKKPDLEIILAENTEKELNDKDYLNVVFANVTGYFNHLIKLIQKKLKDQFKNTGALQVAATMMAQDEQQNINTNEKDETNI